MVVRARGFPDALREQQRLLNAEGMLRVLATWLTGDRQACSMVRVPTPEEEDAKRPHLEREQLLADRLRIENLIEALLTRRAAGEGRHCVPRSVVAALRSGNRRALPPLLRNEIDRLRHRLVLVLVLELIRELEAARADAVEKAEAADTRGATPSSSSDAQRLLQSPRLMTRALTGL